MNRKKVQDSGYPSDYLDKIPTEKNTLNTIRSTYGTLASEHTASTN